MAEEISKEYDVIIIGCGIAGSVAGALLSRMRRKKVLILGQTGVTGGRATSFRGEGIKDAKEFRKTLAWLPTPGFAIRRNRACPR